jgi:hypothetical protein
LNDPEKNYCPGRAAGPHDRELITAGKLPKQSTLKFDPGYFRGERGTKYDGDRVVIVKESNLWVAKSSLPPFLPHLCDSEPVSPNFCRHASLSRMQSKRTWLSASVNR